MRKNCWFTVFVYYLLFVCFAFNVCSIIIAFDTFMIDFIGPTVIIALPQKSPFLCETVYSLVLIIHYDLR